MHRAVPSQRSSQCTCKVLHHAELTMQTGSRDVPRGACKHRFCCVACSLHHCVTGGAACIATGLNLAALQKSRRQQNSAEIKVFSAPFSAGPTTM